MTMKCFRVFADYIKNRDHPTYDFKVNDEHIKCKDIEKWFKKYYSWLTVYNVIEISEEFASIWVLNLYSNNTGFRIKAKQQKRKEQYYEQQ